MKRRMSFPTCRPMAASASEEVDDDVDEKEIGEDFDDELGTFEAVGRGRQPVANLTDGPGSPSY